MPDDPGTAIAFHRVSGGLDGSLHRIDLVILSHHLPGPSTVGLEQDEALHEIEEATWLEDAPQHYL